MFCWLNPRGTGVGVYGCGIVQFSVRLGEHVLLWVMGRRVQDDVRAREV
jgi:hypothetical protein